jgi:hypothetical protein
MELKRWRLTTGQCLAAAPTVGNVTFHWTPPPWEAQTSMPDPDQMRAHVTVRQLQEEFERLSGSRRVVALVVLVALLVLFLLPLRP